VNAGDMRATVRIVNTTRWRTDHLRAFVMRARAEVFGEDPAPLLVKFRPSRTVLHGRASVGHKSPELRRLRRMGSTNWLPTRREFSKTSLACLLVHELSHNAGLRSERDMPAFGPMARARVEAWAEALPLEPATEAAKPTAPSYADKLARIEARFRAWQSKAKRAATALRKLSRQRRYYERKQAASHEAP